MAIAGETASSFTLGNADVGAAITVTVTYTDGQGTTEALTSSATSAVQNVNDAPTGAAVVQGVLIEGQQLTPDTSTIADADGPRRLLLSMVPTAALRSRARRGPTTF